MPRPLLPGSTQADLVHALPRRLLKKGELNLPSAKKSLLRAWDPKVDCLHVSFGEGLIGILAVAPFHMSFPLGRLPRMRAGAVCNVRTCSWQVACKSVLGCGQVGQRGYGVPNLWNSWSGSAEVCLTEVGCFRNDGNAHWRETVPQLQTAAGRRTEGQDLRDEPSGGSTRPAATLCRGDRVAKFCTDTLTISLPATEDARVIIVFYA